MAQIRSLAGKMVIIKVVVLLGSAFTCDPSPDIKQCWRRGYNNPNVRYYVNKCVC